MLFYFSFLLLSYFLYLQSKVYYQDKEHLLELDYNVTLKYNDYYKDSKKLILYSILIYYLDSILGLNMVNTTNIIKGTFFLFSFINLFKITHGVYFKKVKYFLYMLFEFTVLYLKIFYINNNILSADNIIFTNFYFIYLLIDT